MSLSNFIEFPEFRPVLIYLYIGHLFIYWSMYDLEVVRCGHRVCLIKLSFFVLFLVHTEGFEVRAYTPTPGYKFVHMK